jgi:hypothetical protein
MTERERMNGQIRVAEMTGVSGLDEKMTGMQGSRLKKSERESEEITIVSL